MIPKAAVEAATKAFRETHYMDDALMNALEAAEPHIAGGNGDYLPGWDDRKTLSRIFQEHAPLPAEGLSDAVYKALIAVAAWGYEQRRQEAE